MVNVRDILEGKGGYGEVAVKAVGLVVSRTVKNPKYAWEQTASEILTARTSKEKGCPKAAFLGLCEEGFVKGVPSGNYTSSKENKRYALKAVQILKKTPALKSDKYKLWEEVMKFEGKDIQHANQMDVVIALWNKGLIEI